MTWLCNWREEFWSNCRERLGTQTMLRGVLLLALGSGFSWKLGELICWETRVVRAWCFRAWWQMMEQRGLPALAQGLDLGKSTLVGSGDLPNMPLAVAMGRSSKPHAGRGCPQWETEERQNFELTDCCMWGFLFFRSPRKSKRRWREAFARKVKRFCLSKKHKVSNQVYSLGIAFGCQIRDLKWQRLKQCSKSGFIVSSMSWVYSNFLLHVLNKHRCFMVSRWLLQLLLLHLLGGR